jgi:hypothetical protein
LVFTLSARYSILFYIIFVSLWSFFTFFVYLKLLQHSQVVKSKSGLKIEPKKSFFSSSFFGEIWIKIASQLWFNLILRKKQIFIIKLSFLYNIRLNFHKKRIFFPKSYNKFQKYISLKIFFWVFFCSNVMLYIKQSFFFVCLFQLSGIICHKKNTFSLPLPWEFFFF